MAARSRIAIGATLIIAAAGGAVAAMQPPQQQRAPTTEASAARTPALAGTKARGGSFDLRELAGSPAVLVFYRGAYCPLCIQRLEQLAGSVDAYERAGARVVAITADPPEIARSTAGDLHGDVTVVSVDQPTLERWGLWPAGAAAPLPAEFVLDADGTVLFEHRGRTAADDAGDVRLLGVLRDRLAAQRAAVR
jgi:mycoredoxin-dependent peroxiredoxin